jgi:hypothetical protein
VAKERLSVPLRTPKGGHSKSGRRPHRHTPVLEALECRELLAASVVSALTQYGVPSAFAISTSGNLSYNFLTIAGGLVGWNGWTPVSGGTGALAISTGSVLVSPTLRPYVFMINSTNSIYFNLMNNSGNWNGWSPVGVGVGAKAIASGVVPIVNQPYVVMINGNNDVFYNYETSVGSWAGWSIVGTNVGALSVSTGIVQVSVSPAVFEPYVFMINGANDVYFKLRNSNGLWSGWSPVGIGVGAAAISAVTMHNQPFVSMQNGAGGIYLNGKNTNATWTGWSAVGAGAAPGAAVASSMVLANTGLNELALTGAGQVYSTSGSTAHWTPWVGLGSLAPGIGTVSMTATSGSTSGPFAFAVGTDGKVYFNDQPTFAKWTTWDSLGAPT